MLGRYRIWKGQQVGFFSFFRFGNVCYCVKGKTNSCGPVIFPEFDIGFLSPGKKVRGVGGGGGGGHEKNWKLIEGGHCFSG